MLVDFVPAIVAGHEKPMSILREVFGPSRKEIWQKLSGEMNARYVDGGFGKGDKVQVFKYKNKSGYARRQGHRQLMTLLEISDVKLGAARKSTAKKAAAKDEDAMAADGSSEASESEG